ncbi:MAG TPA: TldD/PmbA family protein, partial [Chloroflexota bacterium]|nr:TldD/PmbA family protein [Chloroflexota bacterium]
MSLLGERRLRTLLEGALAACRDADQAEAVILTEDSALTRFASNTIHQNVAERNASVRIRAISGKRMGVATTNSLDAHAIREAAASACAISGFSEPNPEFSSLPSPTPIEAVPGAFSDSTAGVTPRARADAAKRIIRRAEADRLVAAGACSTTTQEVAVANSLGVFAYHPSTAADANLVVMGNSSSGYADLAAVDFASLDFDAMADEACRRATRSANPRGIEPGEYEVVLEPYAVGEMLDYLAYVGFGATAFLEGRSFMSEVRGKRVASREVTIYDDGLDPACLAMPFDFEGVPKQRLDLISDGVARDVAWDSYTAGRADRQSTGHALPAPNPEGPFPWHLHLAPGAASLEELIGGIERGLWVSRFHYVNPIQPLETTITGMTRDGTWWVEEGQVQYPVMNLRFSQSILGALCSVKGIGRNLKLERGFFGGSLVPALRL